MLQYHQRAEGRVEGTRQVLIFWYALKKLSPTEEQCSMQYIAFSWKQGQRKHISHTQNSDDKGLRAAKNSVAKIHSPEPSNKMTA